MEKLDQYRPNLETLQSVRREIIKSGIALEDIPNDWIEVAIAATAKWIATTESGALAAISLLGFKATPGNPEHEYIHYPETGPREEPVKPENVLFLQGLLINGQPSSPASLDVKEKSDETCEDCSIISHCTQLVLEPYSNHLMRLCNNCIVYHENPRVSDQGDKKSCDECSRLRCSHNPANTDKLRKFG